MLPLTKRQREILDYLNEFITQHGYAPSLEEIGRRFGLSSLATVHKHLTNLQEKGFIKRAWNRSRSVEMVPTRAGGRAVELPLLGYVAAGVPIEAIASTETIAVPEDLVDKRDTYVLRVRGDSMIDEQIRDGDFVIVEDRKTADVAGPPTESSAGDDHCRYLPAWKTEKPLELPFRVRGRVCRGNRQVGHAVLPGAHHVEGAAFSGGPHAPYPHHRPRIVP